MQDEPLIFALDAGCADSVFSTRWDSSVFCIRVANYIHSNGSPLSHPLDCIAVAEVARSDESVTAALASHGFCSLGPICC